MASSLRRTYSSVVDDPHMKDVLFELQLTLEEQTPDHIRERVLELRRKHTAAELRRMAPLVLGALHNTSNLTSMEKAHRFVAFCDGAGISDRDAMAISIEFKNRLNEIRRDSAPRPRKRHE